MELKMKIFVKGTLVPIFFVLINSASANAATWNVFSFSIDNTNNVFLFDSATVQRKGSIKNIWIKRISWGKLSADSSVAFSDDSQFEFNCEKRLAQIITQIKYDANKKITTSTFTAGDQFNIPPDTNLDSIYNVVCQSDFPKSKSGKYYSRLADNDDPYEWAKAIDDFKFLRNPPSSK
jgi:hypothetical protein